MNGRVAVITILIACGGGSSSGPAPTEPIAPTPLPDAGTSDTRRNELAQHCAESFEVLGTGPDDMQTAMATVMLTCSESCDLGHEPSCSKLDDFFTTSCEAVISICDQMCEKDLESASLKRAACAHDSTP